MNAASQPSAADAARLLAAIVESSDDAIISKDLNGTITSWNRGAERLFGYAAEEVIGRSITILIPADRRDEEPTILTRVRKGERVDHYETVRRRKDGSLVDISLTVSPVKDADGRIVGASKIARDISERRQAQERQRLLLREMSHRVKNAFALAGSLVALSARSARDPADMAAVVGERLRALARAHEHILPDSSWDQGRPTAPMTLHALLRTILAPYESVDQPGRLVIAGCEADVGSSAVSSLALLIQEFATNAAKHGALASPTGRVEISCSESADEVVVTWTERGGVPIGGPPATEGFGSLLARATVTGQLGGRISRDWQPDGLSVRLSVSRRQLAP